MTWWERLWSSKKMAKETAYVIERSYNSVVHYWDGTSAQGFLADDTAAVRFARETDAAVVLRDMLTGLGCVRLHEWK